MKASAIALATSVAVLVAGSAWAEKDEARPGGVGKAAAHQSEKAMERSNAQWKDSAQKGADRAASVQSEGEKAVKRSNEQSKDAAQKGTEQADAVKSKGAKLGNEIDAQAEKLVEAPGKRDESAMDR
jgi:hypothetical protein